MNPNSILPILIVTGVCAIRSLLADPVPIIDINPSTQVVSGTPGPGQYQGFDEGHVNGMIGYTFFLNQPITVTQVGWYDHGQDGLSRSFRVGLWMDTSGQVNPYFISLNNPEQNTVQLLGNLVVPGITIPAGTTASLNGVWRVVNLPSPLTLQPGGYELAGLDTATTPDVTRYVLGGPSNPQVTIGSPVFNGLGLDQPGFHISTSFIAVYGLELGPMLFSTIPEPSALVLGGLGVMAILLKRTYKQLRIPCFRKGAGKT